RSWCLRGLGLDECGVLLVPLRAHALPDASGDGLSASLHRLRTGSRDGLATEDVVREGAQGRVVVALLAHLSDDIGELRVPIVPAVRRPGGVYLVFALRLAHGQRHHLRESPALGRLPVRGGARGEQGGEAPEMGTDASA